MLGNSDLNVDLREKVFNANFTLATASPSEQL